MIRRLLRPSPRDDAAAPARPHSFGCTNCPAEFDEWIEDCPRCGQLVGRFVEPPG